MLFTLAAWATEPVTVPEPFPIVAQGAEVRATAYAIPPQDPAWVTEDAPSFRCTVTVSFSPPDTVSAEATECPAVMAPVLVEASATWRFEGQEATRFPIVWELRYDKTVQVLTLHAEVDPGPDWPDRGPAGVKLVHPAAITKQKHGKTKGDPASCSVALTVDGRGKVAATQIHECPAELAPTATKLASRWKFTPRVVDGLTDKQTVVVTVRFE